MAFVPGILTAVPAIGYLGRRGARWLARHPGAVCGAPGADGPGDSSASARRRTIDPADGRPLREMLSPLRHVRVWRFGLYYVVVFGAYVALSGWLPKFYIDTYGVSLSTAALLTASFIIPASLLRPARRLPGRPVGTAWRHLRRVHRDDRRVDPPLDAQRQVRRRCAAVGPAGRRLTFTYRLGLGPFALLTFVLGCAMGIGKASVYKYIPDYFPRHVGAVGGIVGMLGALGGFFLPPAFGMFGRWSGVPQLAFTALLALTVWSLAWLHLAVMRLHAAKFPVDIEGRLSAQYTAASPL